MSFKGLLSVDRTPEWWSKMGFRRLAKQDKAKRFLVLLHNLPTIFVNESAGQ